eukprot:5049699-Prymnesium_polylepis.1
MPNVRSACLSRPYASAQSKKLMPASRAATTVAVAATCEIAPHVMSSVPFSTDPASCMVPRHTRLTFRSVPGKVTRAMSG